MKNFRREVMHGNDLRMLRDTSRPMLSFQRPLERSEAGRFLASVES